MSVAHSVPSAPPRTAERLLEALGATAAYRDAVLGDLAEEFGLHEASSGTRAARRWYWREALRTAPYLLRDWGRHLRPRDVADLAGVVFVAHALLFIAATFVVVAINGALLVALGNPMPRWVLHTPAATLPLTGGGAFVGGYLAAWLGNRAPLPTALAFGAPWACLLVGAQAVIGIAPPWFRVITPLAIMLGTVLGGAYRSATAVPSAPD